MNCMAGNVFLPPNRRSRLDEGPDGPKSGAGCYLELWPGGGVGLERHPPILVLPAPRHEAQ